eukprot:3759782-Amphidinium_carterae.1
MDIATCHRTQGDTLPDTNSRELAIFQEDGFTLPCHRACVQSHRVIMSNSLKTVSRCHVFERVFRHMSPINQSETSHALAQLRAAAPNLRLLPVMIQVGVVLDMMSTLPILPMLSSLRDILRQCCKHMSAATAVVEAPFCQ